MPLPTTKTPKKTALTDQSLLIYGASKIGKSTWCSRADGALFLATEAGLNHIEAAQVPCAKWEDILVACGEIAAGGHPYKTIVIDTVDNAYRFCSEYVCAKNGWANPADGDYGKGFALVNGEFLRVLTKLSLLPYGLILVSHAQDVEIKTRTGTRNKTMPTLPKKAREIVIGLVDAILYCEALTVADASGVVTTQRVMHTRPSEDYEAGSRCGAMPETIPLSYAQFLAAFTAANTQAPTAAMTQTVPGKLTIITTDT